jgi:hypothetical protein
MRSTAISEAWRYYGIVVTMKIEVRTWLDVRADEYRWEIGTVRPSNVVNMADGSGSMVTLIESPDSFARLSLSNAAAS